MTVVNRITPICPRRARPGSPNPMSALLTAHALRKMRLELTSQSDLDALLRTVVRHTVDLLQGTSGGLYLYRSAQDLLERITDAGAGIAAVGGTLRRGEGLAGRIWELGTALTVDDYRVWEGRVPGYEGLPVVSAVGVPIRWGDEFLGVVSVASNERAAFTPADAELLRLAASQIAVAIRNARLYEQARRRADRLAVVNHVARAVSAILRLDDLVEIVYQEIASVFEADAFFIALYDEQRQELDFRLQVDEDIRAPLERRPLGNSLTDLVIQTRSPLLIRDFEAERGDLPVAEVWGTMKVPRSWLGVPMQTGGRVVGVIAVQAYPPHVYGVEEQELLSTIADQVAVAVDNARLYEALQESQEAERCFQAQLKALHNVSNELSKAPTFDHLCRAAVELGQRDLGFDRLGIWFLDDDPAYVVGSYGIDEAGHVRDERHVRRRLGPDHLMTDTLTRKTELTYLPKVALHDQRGRAVGQGWVAIASLWDGDRVIGAVSADNLLHGQPIARHQLEILHLYGSTLGHLCTRKRAEEALRESEAQFRRLTENAQDIICRLSLRDVRVAYISPALTELTGYTPQELYADPELVRRIVHPDCLINFRKAWPGILAGRIPSSYEYQIVHRSGESRWMYQRNVIVHDAERMGKRSRSKRS